MALWIEKWPDCEIANGIISVPTVMLAVFTEEKKKKNLISLLAMVMSRNTNKCMLSQATKWVCGSKSRVIFIQHYQGSTQCILQMISEAYMWNIATGWPTMKSYSYLYSLNLCSLNYIV